MKHYELIPHTADLSIRLRGTTLEELFCTAVEGFFSMRMPVYSQRKPQVRTVVLQASRAELLLVDFLSEILYLSATYKETYTVKMLTITHKQDMLSLEATLIGKEYTDYQGVEIKAVTYYNLHIHHTHEGYETTVTFDI